MTKDSMIIIGAAVAGVGLVYWLTRRGAAQAGGATASKDRQTGVVEITNSALPGSEGYGWRYFSDGTAIDPIGNYFKDGLPIVMNLAH